MVTDHLLFCTALMMVGWGKVATGISIWFLTRNNRPRIGTSGRIALGVAAFSFHATGYYNNYWDVPDFGPLIQILGPMLLTSTAVMHLMDFGSESRRRFFWRWTRTVRLFGLLSLTAFLLEGTVSALLRHIVEIVKPGFTYNADFLFVIFAPFVVLCWFIALKLWARVNFAGSFEWLLVQASNRLTGKVSRRLDAVILLNSAEAYFGKHSPTDTA